MDAGYDVHVTASVRVPGVRCGADVSSSFCASSERLLVEAHIEMRIKIRLGVACTYGKDSFRTEGALKHLINLPHGRSGITPYRQEGRLGTLWRLRSSYAEEVPSGVFDVVRVHGAM